jgi:hypothetical protein
MTEQPDPRIAVLSALSSPGWHPVPEAHGMPWDEAVALLDAYDASRAAAPAAAPSAPADRATLRDRIAAAIWERQNPGRHWVDCEYRWRADAEADADAVLAVLPEPADDAAGVAEAIRSFPFDNFGMDDVSFALEDDPEAQEWVPALADAVLSVLPATTDQAAEVANLRTMYDAASARENELIDERDKLIRWHREDGENGAKMLGTIKRLRAELKQQPDRAAILREAAEIADRLMDERYGPDCSYAIGGQDVARELRRMADEAQQPETQAARRVLTPNEHDRAWHAIEGAAGDPGADPGTVLNAVLRALRIDAPTAEDEQAASPRRKADGTRQDETLPAEAPARIDRMRPEFTDHASVESIDVQLRRARSHLRRWHLRVEWLISLRQARVEQKERGEWPAAVSQPGKEA